MRYICKSSWIRASTKGHKCKGNQLQKHWLSSFIREVLNLVSKVVLLAIYTVIANVSFPILSFCYPLYNSSHCWHPSSQIAFPDQYDVQTYHQETNLLILSVQMGRITVQISSWALIMCSCVVLSPVATLILEDVCMY